MPTPPTHRTLLFVVNVDWFFLSHRLPIAQQAQQRGYDVHIACALTDKREVLEGQGITVHPITLDRSSVGVWSALDATRQMAQVMRRVRPDLVHLVTIKPVVLGGIAARLTRVPSLVAAVSGLGYIFVDQGPKALLRRALVSIPYRLAVGHPNSRVIFQNTDDRDALVRMTGLPSDRIVMIPGSGADLTEYAVTPLPDGPPIVLLAARLLVNKGVRVFAEAARIVRERHPDTPARFVLVGEPDPANPESLTAEELARWVDEGTVEHWGFRSDMPDVMASASIVTLPSFYGEGLPKVLIEAAACGRAIVTTDHPGCRDTVVPGQTGLLVPTRDAEALANAIGTLLADPARCAAMGLAGRAYAERTFDVKHVVDVHMGIYDELAAGSTP